MFKDFLFQTRFFSLYCKELNVISCQDSFVFKAKDQDITSGYWFDNKRKIE